MGKGAGDLRRRLEKEQVEWPYHAALPRSLEAPIPKEKRNQGMSRTPNLPRN